MHTAEKSKIEIDPLPVNRSDALVELPAETRLILFRALSDYCKPADEDGLLNETFAEWHHGLWQGVGEGVPTEALQGMITSKITALKLNHKNYAMTLRPDVQEFVNAAEQRLREMAVPILLDLRETLKKSLNGHAR